MNPDRIEPAVEEAGLTRHLPDCDVAGDAIDTGDEARCFAQYMRIHALEASGGLTYAETGRFVPPRTPTTPQGPTTKPRPRRTRRPAGRELRAEHMGDRDRPRTALNVAYMAPRSRCLASSSGIALILTGIGLLILALAIFSRRDQAAAS